MMFNALFNRVKVFKENLIGSIRLWVEDLKRWSGEVLEEVEDYSNNKEDKSV